MSPSTFFDFIPHIVAPRENGAWSPLREVAVCVWRVGGGGNGKYNPSDAILRRAPEGKGGGGPL